MLALGKTELLVIYLLLARKGWMSTQAILNLLGMIRKSESAVRATLFRLRKKNIIRQTHKGRETLFSLADTGKDMAAEYMDRLALSEKKWDGKWLLLSFNIPESRRSARNTLRTELNALGFGRLHTNLWISPYDIRKECHKIIDRLKIKESTTLFITDYVSDDSKQLAARVWDLETLAGKWGRFHEDCRKSYETFKKTRFTNDYQEAVKALTRLIKLKQDLVALAAEDPCLPYDLLSASPVYYGEMGDKLFKYLDFFREKSASIIKFDPIEHEKRYKIAKH